MEAALVVVCGLLMAVASLVESGLWACGLSSCSSQALEHTLSGCSAWALLLCGRRGLPGLGPELVSSVLANRFLATEPPGKHPHLLKKKNLHYIYNNLWNKCPPFTYFYPGGGFFLPVPVLWSNNLRCLPLRFFQLSFLKLRDFP